MEDRGGDHGPSPAPVDFVCQDPGHLDRGRDRPDGSGHITLYEGRWAYCSAGIPNTTHRWTVTGGVSLEQLSRDELPQLAGADG